MPPQGYDQSYTATLAKCGWAFHACGDMDADAILKEMGQMVDRLGTHGATDADSGRHLARMLVNA